MRVSFREGIRTATISVGTIRVELMTSLSIDTDQYVCDLMSNIHSAKEKSMALWI
jgi:hypothetical protein